MNIVIGIIISSLTLGNIYLDDNNANEPLDIQLEQYLGAFSENICKVQTDKTNSVACKMACTYLTEYLSVEDASEETGTKCPYLSDYKE